MTTTENVRLYQDRAYAATRVLECRRISLEAAVEVLEIVGYKVYQNREGHYNVEPPRDKISKFDAFPEVKPTPRGQGRISGGLPDHAHGKRRGRHYLLRGGQHPQALQRREDSLHEGRWSHS